MWEVPPFEELAATVRDASRPIGMRMRAAYFLRSVHDAAAGEEERQALVVAALSDGLTDERHGSLMRHEFAYVMGQLRDERCCPVLEQTLQRESDCVMVRHEAAEALGAIGASTSTSVLEKVKNDSDGIPELAETCQIALDVMAWRSSGGDPVDMPAACACMLNPYSSVDPAPPHPAHASKSTKELGDILCDVKLPLFARYRAMFSLRNLGGAEAVAQLCRALTTDTSSALLRHEVAYVLGQMQHPDSVESLEESLRRVDEHKMVRHESAEALGAIDGRWQDVERILKEFETDDDDVVRESCLVALDAADYWGHSDPTEDAPEKDDSAKPTSFSVQKNQSNGVLANHFNVAAKAELETATPPDAAVATVVAPAPSPAQLLYQVSQARSSLRSQDLLLTAMARAGLIQTAATSAALWIEQLLLESTSEDGTVDWTRIRNTILSRYEQNPTNPLLQAVLANSDWCPETIVVDKNKRQQLKAAQQQQTIGGDSKKSSARNKKGGRTSSSRTAAAAAAAAKKPVSTDLKTAKAAWKDSLSKQQQDDMEREPSQIIEDEEDYD